MGMSIETSQRTGAYRGYVSAHHGPMIVSGNRLEFQKARRLRNILVNIMPVLYETIPPKAAMASVGAAVMGMQSKNMAT